MVRGGLIWVIRRIWNICLFNVLLFLFWKAAQCHRDSHLQINCRHDPTQKCLRDCVHSKHAESLCSPLGWLRVCDEEDSCRETSSASINDAPDQPDSHSSWQTSRKQANGVWNVPSHRTGQLLDTIYSRILPRNNTAAAFYVWGLSNSCGAALEIKGFRFAGSWLGLRLFAQRPIQEQKWA